MHHTHSPLVRRVVVGAVGAACKGLMAATTQVRVHGREHLLHALEENARTHKPLVVAMNHASPLDDPMLLSALLPLRTLCGGRMRWALGASDVLFTNALLRVFFSAGQVLCVERGAGLRQPAMRAALELLDRGEWLVVFPEGRVVPSSGRAAGLGAFRWGVGHLVKHAAHPPIVVPIVHAGMERVCPLHSRAFVPGQTVHVAVGAPVDTAEMRMLDLPAITDAVRSRMLSLYAHLPPLSGSGGVS